MRRALWLFGQRLPLALLATALVAAACGEDSVPLAPEAPEVALGPLMAKVVQPGPDDWIVVFKASVADPPGLALRLINEHGGTLRFTYEYALKGFAATLPPQALNGIRNNPSVDYVEADGVVTADPAQPNPPSWGLDRVDQPNLPLDNSYTYNFDGTGVTAYIIDTGIRTTHVDFGPRASPGFDGIDGVADGNDCHGHGTHVAGTVGGSSYGVAKGVDLVAVRVLNCAGSGTLSGVIAGVDWVTNDHVGAAVANMSLGGGASSSLDQAVANSVNAGVTYAVSAGNSNANACNQSPSREPSALTTGSTTSSDARSSFSNFGSCVDIFAPGSSITSAWGTGDNATNTISGTSMASPHVAGAAALILHENPGWTPGQVAAEIDSRATRDVISNVGAGSPNELLCTLSTCGGGGGGATPVEVAGVSDVRYSGNKHKSGTVDVTVVEEGTGTPMANVTATVNWFKNGGATPVKSSTGLTDASGVATTSSGSVKGASTLEACVVALSGNGYTDATDYASDPVCSGIGGGGGGGGDEPATDLTAQVKKGKPRVQLSWTPWSASSVDVWRDGVQIATTANDGSYTDQGGQPDNVYQVCAAGTSECSNSATAN